MKALFIDFEDSFSFNVVQELTLTGLSVEVINWNDFSAHHDADLLVLGPGPGHPDDYQSVFPLIQNWLQDHKKIFAICLGHQILWRLMGKEVVRSEHPLHGQKVRLTLGPEWQKWLSLPQEVWVQRYNSLAVVGDPGIFGVKNHLENNEVVISRTKTVISYQFHPESVGTNCRRAFFNVISSHLL